MDAMMKAQSSAPPLWWMDLHIKEDQSSVCEEYIAICESWYSSRTCFVWPTTFYMYDCCRSLLCAVVKFSRDFVCDERKSNSLDNYPFSSCVRLSYTKAILLPVRALIITRSGIWLVFVINLSLRRPKQTVKNERKIGLGDFFLSSKQGSQKCTFCSHIWHKTRFDPRRSKVQKTLKP